MKKMRREKREPEPRLLKPFSLGHQNIPIKRYSFRCITSQTEEQADGTCLMQTLCADS